MNISEVLAHHGDAYQYIKLIKHKQKIVCHNYQINNKGTFLFEINDNFIYVLRLFSTNRETKLLKKLTQCTNVIGLKFMNNSDSFFTYSFKMLIIWLYDANKGWFKFKEFQREPRTFIFFFNNKDDQLISASSNGQIKIYDKDNNWQNCQIVYVKEVEIKDMIINDKDDKLIYVSHAYIKFYITLMELTKDRKWQMVHKIYIERDCKLYQFSNHLFFQRVTSCSQFFELQVENQQLNIGKEVDSFGEHYLDSKLNFNECKQNSLLLFGQDKNIHIIKPYESNQNFKYVQDSVKIISNDGRFCIVLNENLGSFYIRGLIQRQLNLKFS